MSIGLPGHFIGSSMPKFFLIKSKLSLLNPAKET